MSEATITIGGTRYVGWKSFSIRRSIETLTGSFSMDVTDDPNRADNTSWALQTQKSIIIKIDNKRLITGYIFKVGAGISKNSHTVVIEGRDKTADLVDCSADLVARSFSFNTTNIQQLAEALCKPFGIKVKVESGTDVSETFKLNINTGESIFELLDRKATQLGILLVTDTSGALVLSNSSRSKASTNLELGVNILSGDASFDFNNRYSEYQVNAQSNESDNWKANINIKGTSKDKGVDRFRPFLIQADGEMSNKVAQLSANWEANVRAARSQAINVTVQGFFQENGDLWEPNKEVSILAPALYINPPVAMLITSVTYNLSEAGSITSLALKRADAYEVNPAESVEAVKNLGV